jgi:hypothetical protein
MVDKREILELLAEYFFFEPNDAVKFDIGPEGLVNVLELTPGRGHLRTIKDKPFPGGQLPVRFGLFKASLKLDRNQIVDLVGCPPVIQGNFVALGNQLKNFKGGPKEVTGRFWLGMQENLLESLDGFPDRVGDYAKLPYHDKLPLLRTLACQDGVILSSSSFNTNPIEEIIEKYKGQGKRALFECQKDLEDAGFEGNARW